MIGAVPYRRMSDGFGGAPFALGVEEELLLVDAEGHQLAHEAPQLLEQIDDLKPDLYLALVESVSPVCAGVADAVGALSTTRARAREAGATLLGAGIHPDGPFGEAPHVPDERYEEIGRQLRGLARRTPTCALHVHVGMPDRETALRAYNGLREHLPLLQALAANSPFWHGLDSGLASARAQMFRGYPRADIPQAFSSWDEYEASIAAILAAGDLPDYTFLWWDLRPHPNLGTVEVRAMDSQSSLRDVAGLAGLVHALARRAAEQPVADPTPREGLMESSYRAARDGLDAAILHEGALRPVPEVAAAVLADLEGDGLDEIVRMAAEGNGAARQRANHERGGMPALLRGLVLEAARPY
jgi:carboxylate-amine ligase